MLLRARLATSRLVLLVARQAQVQAAGRRLLRLDCVETNPTLRRYYERLGFRVVGRREFNRPGWHPTILFERNL